MLNYKFNDENILNRAFTHSSYSNEKNGEFEDNERLEFLGDAVLEFVSSSYIYKNYPDLKEGEMTKLRAACVCETSLAKVARQIGIDKLIVLGKGEENLGGRNRDSIVSDAFEAVIGAIYIDGGIENARKFILENMEDTIKELSGCFKYLDSKTYLQEVIQEKSREPLKYEVIGESGPAHEKTFEVRVSHNGIALGIGEGKSKKDAQQKAAYNALIKLGIK